MDAILLCLAFFVLVVLSGGWVAGGASAKWYVIGPLALILELLLLWLTVNRWSKFVAALIIVRGVGVVGLLFDPAHRRLGLLMLAYLIATVALTFRFFNHRPKTDEKIALVFFVVVCLLSAFVSASEKGRPLASALGWSLALGALLAVRVKDLLFPPRLAGASGGAPAHWRCPRFRYNDGQDDANHAP
jgi:small-conductance mechanosensitive channel